jgi:hypothetical protein
MNTAPLVVASPTNDEPDLLQVRRPATARATSHQYSIIKSSNHQIFKSSHYLIITFSFSFEFQNKAV